MRMSNLRRWLRGKIRLLRYSYDSKAFSDVLTNVLGDRKLGSAATRLCIPSFEGEYGEVFVFKTPRHPTFKKDLFEPMVKVALATAAAPTYFRPHRDGGYTFVDGGVWANNPIMIAVTEALTSFDIHRDQVRILSIGCGDDPYRVTSSKIFKGGICYWKDIILAAMRLQSLSALGQAGLIVGPESLVRLDVPKSVPKIELDDWLWLSSTCRRGPRALSLLQLTVSSRCSCKSRHSLTPRSISLTEPGNICARSGRATALRQRARRKARVPRWRGALDSNSNWRFADFARLDRAANRSSEDATYFEELRLERSGRCPMAFSTAARTSPAASFTYSAVVAGSACRAASCVAAAWTLATSVTYRARTS